MARVLTLGKMGLNTQEYGTKIEFMVLESISGMMEELMKVTGKKIIWMDTESIFGKMVESMRDNTKRTRNTVMEFILGLTEENMMVSGLMVDNMGKESIFHKLVNSVKECGQMVKEKSGMIIIHTKTKTREHCIEQYFEFRFLMKFLNYNKIKYY